MPAQRIQNVSRQPSKKSYQEKVVRIVYDAKVRIANGFSTTDKISDCLKSGLVYEVTHPTAHLLIFTVKGQNFIEQTLKCSCLLVRTTVADWFIGTFEEDFQKE
ncbi:unnamed protein product [Didymodactylos carnosus]|uniref:Uncharacterized protein n=1 Tax=Didymodactylos carnosus TaxID=1234261 RepID=A0A815A2W0_9BILA|nr:unnamed protein product [Didymodactylos carnosus]CAF1251564.1 unnamed protein product [Didymodactylos carnosus]CAF3868818.1 unnamed protein product [Didymodactylos carnosus]CAF4021464.1 unnamed protein product [Didymodactylos carnosus]